MKSTRIEANKRNACTEPRLDICQSARTEPRSDRGGVEKSHNSAVIIAESIENQIFIIRGQKVMIDRGLAMLYGVTTRHLNRQVKRNIERFPAEFMFRLSMEEKNELVPKWYQFEKLKHSKSLPYAFTEHGVAMLASVLKSKIAVKISIIIIKTFIKVRQIITSHKELAAQIGEHGRAIKCHDENIIIIFEAIKQLIKEEEKPKKKFGFIQ